MLLETLEDRNAPATHVWSGAASSLMSADGNWSSGGHPVNGEAGAIVLVFPNTATQFQVTDDLDGLNVDQIQFTGAQSHYVISGAAGGVTLNLTGAAGNQPNIDDQVGSNTFSATNLTLALTGNVQVSVAPAGGLSIASPLTGSSGLTKIGTGILQLGGNSPSYTGTTTVNGGVLQVNNNVNFSNGSFQVNQNATLTDNGLAGQTTVNNGGTLGGIGTASVVTVNGGGRVSGGGVGEIGKISITGGANALTLNANSTFLEEINSAGSFDQVNVTGSATLGGTTLLVSFGGNLAVGDTLAIVNTTTGLSGTFKDPLGNTLNNLDTFEDNGRVYQIQYTNTAVHLTMVAFVSQTSLASSQNPSSVGQPVTFTVTISTPAPGAPNRGGTVTFFDGSTQLGNPVNVSNNQALLTTSALLAGTRAINAMYSGDANFQGSSGVLNPPQVVNKLASTTSLTSDTNPVDYGVTYTFTATVAPATPGGSTPTGDVTFIDIATGATLGVRTLNPSGDAVLKVDGTSVAFLDAGSRTVRASYPGDDSYVLSSATFTETVNQVNTSTSVTNDHPSGSVFGEPVTYTATVTSSTVTPVGNVTFTADDGLGHVTPMGTKDLDSNGKAALTFNALPVGTFTITAAFSANVDFRASSGTTSETVSQGTTSSGLTTSKSPTVFGEPVTFTATVTANAPSTLPPAGSVTFIDTTTNSTLGTANLVASGTGKATAHLTVSSLSASTAGMSHTIEADYNTDGNYATSSATTVQTVNPAPTTTIAGSSANPSHFGEPVTFTVIVNASPSVAPPTGFITLTITGFGMINLTLHNGQATFVTAALSVGDHGVIASYSSSDNNQFLSSSTANPAVTQTVLKPLPAIAVGVDKGGPPRVIMYNAAGQPTASFLAYPPTFNGGVRVAMADLNGDQVPDIIVAPGPGAVLPVKVIDGTKVHQVQANGQISAHALLGSFFVYGTSFQDGIFVAAGDVNGDGKADIITGAGSGSRVEVINSTRVNGVTKGRIAPSALIANFLAYDASYTGGVTVAAGDVNKDGRADIVVGPAQGNQPVEVVNSALRNRRTATGQIAPGALVSSFFAYPGFNGGVVVAAGDVNGDGRAEIIVGAGAGPGLGRQVRTFNGSNGDLISVIGAFGASYQGGVHVAAVDLDGDGLAEVLAATSPTGSGLGGLRILHPLSHSIALSLLLDVDGVFVAGA